MLLPHRQWWKTSRLIVIIPLEPKGKYWYAFVLGENQYKRQVDSAKVEFRHTRCVRVNWVALKVIAM